MRFRAAVFLFLCCFNMAASADIPAVTIIDDLGKENTYSINLQIIALMTLLTVIPALILTMTSFTRIIIVLGILRQAMGMPQTPSNQILIGIGLFLTMFIMSPIAQEVNKMALTPYMEEKMNIATAIDKAKVPIKNFMLKQTRKNDLEIFLSISKIDIDYETADELATYDLPLSVIIPAFITSELKTGFQIGFLLFIPFLIIDLVVASILMAMGMMMLSPLIISLPFKIMLFLLVDGWSLVVGTIAGSF